MCGNPLSPPPGRRMHSGGQGGNLSLGAGVVYVVVVIFMKSRIIFWGFCSGNSIR